jgi:hypothetical protein
MLNFLDVALYIFRSMLVETFSSLCSSNRKRDELAKIFRF